MVAYFFQSHRYFDQSTIQNSKISDSLKRVIVDLHSVGFENQNYIWSIHGGHYLPSLLYKIRVIHIFEGGNVKSRIFVAGGFAEVTAERCTVLAEEALRLEDIDRTQVEKDLQEATEDISDAGDNGAERALAEQRAETARAKLASLDSQIYQ